MTLREAYRWHRRVRGKPRERALLYLLRLELGPDYKIRRVRAREQALSPEHRPDIRIWHHGRFVCEIEVTGLEIPWSQLKLRDTVFVLTTKAEYARQHPAPKRYIYVLVNDGVLMALDPMDVAEQIRDVLDKARGYTELRASLLKLVKRMAETAWLLWLPGDELARLTELAQVWDGETRWGVRERYYMLKKRQFRTSWWGLTSYIRYLAGELADPNPLALVNFMA